MPAETLELRKMTEEDFAQCLGPMVESYAQDITRNIRRPIDEVRKEAQEQVNRILPNGLSTDGHLIFNVVESTTGERIGHIWVSLEKEENRAFLYDILIEAPFRGRGFGRRSLQLIETKLRELGIKQLGLHVFGDNQTAISLYKTQGYYTTGFNMQKEL